MAKAKPTGPQTGQPRVYSYIRFSTPEQALGDSERRQLDDAKSWAKRNGHDFDESLRMTDRGLSGYHGTHRKTGALGRFLKFVEARAIPPGSILLVENVDRLSREGVSKTLREIIFKLWDRGVILQTLSPEETYPPGSDDSPHFLALLIYMQRARDESKKKSDRVSAARETGRKHARETGRILTKQVPAWLRVTGDKNADGRIAHDRKFELIAAAVDVVRKIFDWKLAGFGVRAIAKKLNAPDGPAGWKPKTGWRGTYVARILKNRAVLGEFQPHQRITGKRQPSGEPIPNYYPVVIDPGVFFAVQKTFTQNQGRGGRRDLASNLFSHLARCAYCGGPMIFARGRTETHIYLRCESGYRGRGCDRHYIPYGEVESIILENCHRLRPETVLPEPDEQKSICETLRQRIRGHESELGEIATKIENLFDQIERTNDPAIRDRYEARIPALNTKTAALTAEIKTDSAALDEAERSLVSFRKWTADLKALRAKLDAGDVDVRRRLQSHLRGFIAKIEVFASGWAAEYDPDSPGPVNRRTRRPERVGDDLWEHIDDQIFEVAPKLTRTKTFRSFLKYVTARRMSKEGRFIRIYFRTGARIDVAPPGSLATGLGLVKTGRGAKAEYRFVSPDIDALWREFRGEPAASGKCTTTF